MMPVALAVSQVLVIVLLWATAIVGWTREGSLALHMYLGMATSLLALLAHTLTLFFFIGTSKAIRLTCEGQPDAEHFVAESNRFKKVLAGRTQLACLVFIVEPVVGAAVYSASLSWLWHHAGFWLCLLVQVWVGYTELELLGCNNVLLNRVAEWKAGAGLPAEPTPAGSGRP